MSRNSVTIRWEADANQLSETLRGIKEDMRANILKEACEKAAVPIRDATARLAPKDTGALAQSIQIKGIANKHEGRGMALIGPSLDAVRKSLGLSRRGFAALRRGLGDVVTPVRYAHLIEFGHVIATGGSLKDRHELTWTAERNAAGKLMRRNRRGKLLERAAGKASGFVAPRPFMRPGLAQGAPAAERIMIEEIGAGIERARAKLIREGLHVKASR